MKQAFLVVIVSLASCFGIHDDLPAQDVGQSPQSVDVQVFVGSKFGEDETILKDEDFSRPGVLIFVADVNETVVDLIKKFNVIVKQSDKNKTAYIVYLSSNEDADANARTTLITADLGIPIYSYGGDEDPPGYKMLKEHAMTVFVCVDSRIVIAKRLSAEDLVSEGQKVLLDFYRLVKDASPIP